jgi:transposase
VEELHQEIMSLRRDLKEARGNQKQRDVEQKRLLDAFAATAAERDSLREENKVLRAEVSTLKTRIKSLEIDCAAKDSTILHLAASVDSLKHLLFGRSSEKEDSEDPEDGSKPDGGAEQAAQGAGDESSEEEGAGEAESDPLGENAEQGEAEAKGSSDSGCGDSGKAGRGGRDKKVGHGRQPLPANLPRKKIPIHPPSEDRLCRCCGEAMRIMKGAEEITERLHWVPASVVVQQFIRFKYSCAMCEEAGVVIGELPPGPIEKGRPTSGMLAYVITSKYCDHLPLYRQEEILARQGLSLNRSTLSGWASTAAYLLRPVVREVIADLLRGDVVRTDETGLKVLDREAEKNIRSARMWAYRRGPGEIVLVHTRTKANDTPGGPKEFLKAYKGYLQADAANGFDHLYKDGKIVEVGCNAHARRPFKKAKDAGVPEASWVLKRFQELYKVEAEARKRGLDHEERLALRQEHSAPVAEKLYSKLEQWQKDATFLPKGLMGKAISYSLNHQKALRRYLEDGRLEIDNNDTERAFRTVALGRHNFLFCGSEAGAHTAAILYSLGIACRELRLNPFAYFSDVLDKIATGFPMSRIAELTPKGWAAAREREAEAAVPLVADGPATPVPDD